MTPRQTVLLLLGVVIIAALILAIVSIYAGPNPNSETTLVTRSTHTYVITTIPRNDIIIGVWYATAKLVGYRDLVAVLSHRQFAQGDTVVGYKINLYLDGEFQNNVYLAKIK